MAIWYGVKRIAAYCKRALLFCMSLTVIMLFAQKGLTLDLSIMAERQECALQQYEEDILNMVNNSQIMIEKYKSKAEDLKKVASKNQANNVINNSSESSSKNFNIYVFVSLSMPKSSLMNLSKQAKKSGAKLVLRGLKDNSYLKTVTALKDYINQSDNDFIIDPNLFFQYNVKVVPTIIVEQENIYDKVVGNISLSYALKTITENGDLKNLANYILQHKL